MGFNSPSFNPENMQVQYLQKIALRAENPFGPQMTVIGTIYIFCVSNFLLPLRQLIFRQKQPGHWGRGCLPFSPCFLSIFCLPNENNKSVLICVICVPLLPFTSGIAQSFEGDAVSFSSPLQTSVGIPTVAFGNFTRSLQGLPVS